MTFYQYTKKPSCCVSTTGVVVSHHMLSKKKPQVLQFRAQNSLAGGNAQRSYRAPAGKATRGCANKNRGTELNGAKQVSTLTHRAGVRENVHASKASSSSKVKSSWPEVGNKNQLLQTRLCEKTPIADAVPRTHPTGCKGKHRTNDIKNPVEVSHKVGARPLRATFSVPVCYRAIRRRYVLGGSSVVGFKKLMYHQVMARGYMLYPSFNRRKHNHSYTMVVNNHHVRLSKMYGYLSKNRIAWIIGFALKAGLTPGLISVPGCKKSVRKRSIPFLVDVIESDTSLVFQRCQHQFFLRKSRQYITHSEWKPYTERLLPFGDTNHRHQTFFGSNIRSKHCRWHTHGDVLRTL